ncbi:MAG: radical SAM protein [Bacteroidales bacterium]|nr:radical SAM protein [Bacteroidales bacterium]
MFSVLTSCNLCPRNCNVNRFEGGTGYCRSDAEYTIASICIHHGEEPVIGGRHGICNIFFPHCNLQCIYCQNSQISRNNSDYPTAKTSLKAIVDKVIRLLGKGCESVGFVSPTHYIPHVHAIIDALHQKGHHPVIVYNTNGYDKVTLLQTLEEKINLYLPDFKYINAKTAWQYSGARNYPEAVKRSIKEMYRQKGNSLILSDTGLALNGLIIRHLVLPGMVNESKNILRWIAEELSPFVHISLMSQYNPPDGLRLPSHLLRKITKKEYDSIVKEMEILGFQNGWIQEPESAGFYNPDFAKDHPFSF